MSELCVTPDKGSNYAKSRLEPPVFVRMSLCACDCSPSVDAGGAGRPLDELEPPAALEDDLAVVLHLPHVGAVVVQTHVAHQQNLGMKVGED